MRRFSTIPLLTLLCAGCTVVSQNRVFPKLDWYWSKDAKAQRESSSITLPMPDTAPVVRSMMAPAVSVPPPPITNIFIPLHWPDDWMNYSWQVFASSNLLDWKLVVTNVDMSAESIDVPSLGEKGFYKLSPFATNQ